MKVRTSYLGELGGPLISEDWRAAVNERAAADQAAERAAHKEATVQALRWAREARRDERVRGHMENIAVLAQGARLYADSETGEMLYAIEQEARLALTEFAAREDLFARDGGRQVGLEATAGQGIKR